MYSVVITVTHLTSNYNHGAGVSENSGAAVIVIVFVRMTVLLISSVFVMLRVGVIMEVLVYSIVAEGGCSPSRVGIGATPFGAGVPVSVPTGLAVFVCVHVGVAVNHIICVANEAEVGRGCASVPTACCRIELNIRLFPE